MVKKIRRALAGLCVAAVAATGAGIATGSIPTPAIADAALAKTPLAKKTQTKVTKPQAKGQTTKGQVAQGQAAQGQATKAKVNAPKATTANATKVISFPSLAVVPPFNLDFKVAPAKPNIVVVMMDDFSMDLVQTMHSARRMKKRGARYKHSFVVDSLCCVSRSSFFTGQYPRQTGVRTNTSNMGRSRLGGWDAFANNGNQQRSFNVRLQQAGYHTGFVGKYLNEYEWVPGRAIPPVVPGWSTFNVVFGSAYDGWGFASTALSDGGIVLRDHPIPPASASAATKDEAYAGTVISNHALHFIKTREAEASPYFLEVAVYAPHNRSQPLGAYPDDPIFPPMFRDRHANGCGRVPCAQLTVKDLPGFGDKRRDNRPRLRNGKPARAWNTAGSMSAAVATRDLRDRARMTQSVDRMMRKILDAVGDNTYVILTSDNGLHLGQQGMGRGKGTAYDTDVRVPLYVVGPGVVPGTRHEVTSNIDLASTFEELAGLKPAAYRAGESLVPTFADRKLSRRNYTFHEHTQQTLTGTDPDAAFSGSEVERIPSYTAVRSRDALLIRLDLDPRADTTRWGYEFYTYKKHRYEKRNQFASPRKQAQVQELMAKLEAWDDCQETGNTPVPRSCRRLTR